MYLPYGQCMANYLEVIPKLQAIYLKCNTSVVVIDILLPKAIKLFIQQCGTYNKTRC